jgi:hypothetical protein
VVRASAGIGDSVSVRSIRSLSARIVFISSMYGAVSIGPGPDVQATVSIAAAAASSATRPQIMNDLIIS